MPSPADTCRNRPLARTRAGRVLVQARARGRVDAAVGNERAETGQADLAAMGVTGEQQVEAVGDEPVQTTGSGECITPSRRSAAGSAGPPILAYRSRLMCESCTPATSMSKSPTLIRPRRLFAFIQPAASKLAPSSAHGRSGTHACGRRRSSARCSAPGSSAPARTGRSTRRRTRLAGRVAARAHRGRGITALAGNRVTSVDDQVGLKGVQRAAGMRAGCAVRGEVGMSEICRIRSGSAPGGSTGTSYLRSANQLRSITAA